MKMVVLVMMGVVCAAMATGCNKGNNSVDATKPIDKKQEAKQQEHVPSVLMTCVLDAMTAFADGKSTYENPACKVDTNKGTDFYNGRQQELVWIFAKKQDGKTERTITAKFPIKWLTTDKDKLNNVREQSVKFMEHITKQESKEQASNSGVATNPLTKEGPDNNCTLGSMTMNGIPGFLFRCDDTSAWVYAGSNNK